MSDKNRIWFYAGTILTILLSAVIMNAFYGNLFGKLNETSFASGGDGLQTYLNIDYHVRYDTSYMSCNSMNYPYGENVFFTNNPPLFSNTVKFISNNIKDISGETIGIFNTLLLLLLAVTPIVLYLIMIELGIGKIVAVFSSLAITFLTPQLDRFGGHFNLSIVCAIPLMILLLLKFFKRPSVWLSFLIFLTVMAGAMTHLYFYGIFAILILFFYGSLVVDRRKLFHHNATVVAHFLVQLVLPYLLLQLMIGNQIADRPAYPWGFLYYRAYPQSVFLPLGKPYAQFLNGEINTSHIDWEGYAFVGVIAFISTMFFLVRMVIFCFKKNFGSAFVVTPNRNINILFWAGIAGLLYSFGIPFILGLEWMVDLIGPVRQMRGVGRFAWLFYYCMNIVTIYWLWEWWKKSGLKILKTIALIAAILIMLTDAWYNVRNRGFSLENTMPAFFDPELKHRDNQWMLKTDPNQYQAIISVPYFHVGSENTWIDGGCDIINRTFTIIRNSGLPSVGTMLSRTSINQTFENVQFMLGPVSAYTDMSRFPNKKPFLLLAANCEMLSSFEKELIARAKQIDSLDLFGIYELPFESFSEVADSIADITKQEFKTSSLFKHQMLRSTDSMKTFVFMNFDSLSAPVSYVGEGCYSSPGKESGIVFSGNLPRADTSFRYRLSFWLNDIRSDLYARTLIRLIEKDENGIEVNNQSWQAFKAIEKIDGSWALINVEFQLKDPSDEITVIINNRLLGNKNIYIDNLLIFRDGTVNFQVSDDRIIKNNRFYISSEIQEL